MFVDANGDAKNYLELQLSPKGTIFDANFKQRPGTGELSSSERIDQAKKFNLDAMDSAVTVDGTINDDSDEDSSWTVELRIPFNAIPGVDGAPSEDASWAANFYRFDRPEDGATHAFAWSTAARGDFHQVDKFGTLSFPTDASGAESASGDGESNSESTDSQKSDDSKESGDDNSKSGTNTQTGGQTDDPDTKQVKQKLKQLDPEQLKRFKQVHGSE
jgi:hypothetical protein